MELAGRTLTVDVGRVAAPGKWCCIYALWRYNRIINRDSSDKPRDGIDFFPLSVEFGGEDVFGRKDSGRI